MQIVLIIVENIRASKKEKLDKVSRKSRDKLFTTVSEEVQEI